MFWQTKYGGSCFMPSGADMRTIRELQQSAEYMEYIATLGWRHQTVDSTYIIYKDIPLYGRIAKMQRPDRLPDIDKCLQFLRDFRIRIFAPEPSTIVSQTDFDDFIHRIRQGRIKLNTSPFLPTKTLRVDLVPSENDIFRSFSEAKRRAVRRAEKNGVRIEHTDNIDTLLQIKNKSAGLFGFITTYGVRQMWQQYAPHHAAITLAYDPSDRVIGGVLLVLWGDTAYYWIAGAVKNGKKLAAPTLLVWETIKIAKARNMKYFDFVGVWDERIPKGNSEWKGFTKFKEGFGGTTVYYPVIKR